MIRSCRSQRRWWGLALLSSLVLGVPEHAIADVHDGDMGRSATPATVAPVSGSHGCADDRLPHVSDRETALAHEAAEHGLPASTGHTRHVCHDGHGHGVTLPDASSEAAPRLPNVAPAIHVAHRPPSRIGEPALRPPIA
ncbi:MAG: hypothetical protein IT361_02855 [Gemmatimonadaceae bacterium]|nr:hypothetical protein [Gemmatimonadaceae bacterium]